MNLFTLSSILICLAAFFSYLNGRTAKLPTGISLLITGTLISLGIIIVGKLSPDFSTLVKKSLVALDFSEFLLGILLSFLLFAGSIHLDIDDLKTTWKSILTFSTLGTLTTTLAMGTILYKVLAILGSPVHWGVAMVFGALISPTDPVAVLGILKKAGIPRPIEIKITGESLFNDGVGVVLFSTFVLVNSSPDMGFNLPSFLLHLLQEGVGGLLAGLVLGYIGYTFIRSAEGFETQVLVSIALVMGGYTLCHFLGFSGPLAMVVAGIYTGNKSRFQGLGKQTWNSFSAFWEVIDEVLNAIVFMLMGLQLVVLKFHPVWVVIGIGLAIAILLVRYAALYGLSLVFNLHKNLGPGVLALMTWGGLRGGISLAMALSIHDQSEGNILIAITFIMVLFSIVVQGLTVERFVRRLNFPIE